MAILIFSLKIHVTLVKKFFGVIIKVKKDSEKNVFFLMIRRLDNFQLNFSDQYKKTIILSIELPSQKNSKIRSSLSWKVPKTTNLDRYELGMFEHILYNSYISLYWNQNDFGKIKYCWHCIIASCQDICTVKNHQCLWQNES